MLSLLMKVRSICSAWLCWFLIALVLSGCESTRKYAVGLVHGAGSDSSGIKLCLKKQGRAEDLAIDLKKTMGDRNSEEYRHAEMLFNRCIVLIHDWKYQTMDEYYEKGVYSVSERDYMESKAGKAIEDFLRLGDGSDVPQRKRDRIDRLSNEVARGLERASSKLNRRSALIAMITEFGKTWGAIFSNTSRDWFDRKYR